MARTPGAGVPSKLARMVCGRRCTSDCVASTWLTSLEPMPKAMAPMPPWVQVWLSPHTRNVPGRLNPSSGPMTWMMPCPGSPRSNNGTPASLLSSRIESSRATNCERVAAVRPGSVLTA